MDFTSVQECYTSLNKSLHSISSAQSSFLDSLSHKSSQMNTLKSMLSTDIPDICSSIQSITALISDLSSRLELIDKSLLTQEISHQESQFQTWKQETYKELQKEEETKK